MTKSILYSYLFLWVGLTVIACSGPARQTAGGATSKESKEKTTSGNPVFPGWYADPEARLFNRQYWVYPTFSAPFEEQVFLDAFSSPDLVHWTKHARIIDTNHVTWAKKRCGRRR
jgi:hypothetical protein